MIFYTASEESRPVRLSEMTRNFAQASLNGKYGADTSACLAVSLDHIADFEKLTDQEKYNAAIIEIAKNAPIRICDGELISGAATLGYAIQGSVPAVYNGKLLFNSLDHLTLDFQKVIQSGINGIESELDIKLTESKLTDRQKATLYGIKNVINALRIWHSRYLEAIKDKNHEIYQNLLRVPFNSPSSFYEAVQSIWFMFSFERLYGNWPGIGRIDEMLGQFLENDLAHGRITIDRAREILAHFFIKGCEWIIPDQTPGTGDAQHYQNLVLGGTDESGDDITNIVTYLILEVIEELPIGDFPITVRFNSKSPLQLKEKMACVIRHGGGTVALYCEETALHALAECGYPGKEAVNFANDGCWEIQIPGKTYFMYIPFDGLQILQHNTFGIDSKEIREYSTFDELYRTYLQNLRKAVFAYLDSATGRYGHFEHEKWIWNEQIPCSVVSLLEGDCIQCGCSYLEGGTRYTVLSPHLGGAADIANSLYAIKKAIFDDKIITFHEIIQALKNDWEGSEVIRQIMRCRYTYYGNDSDEADNIWANLLNDFSQIVSEYRGSPEIIYTAGISTFGRQINWKDMRAAAPFGSKRGDILAPNASPTPGTDTEGATAAIRSYCKAELYRQGTGAALDLKLHPSSVTDENGIAALVSLMNGFCALGGFFLQIDVADANVLRDAQIHPENYRTLSVRVSGWNARFITLDREWQQMIIEKTEQKL